MARAARRGGGIGSSDWVDPIRAERGRTVVTSILSLILAIALIFLYFLIPQGEVSTLQDFARALIPSLVAVLVAFTVVVFSKGLGIWQRSDKLDSIIAFLDRQRQESLDDFRIFSSSHELPWYELFSPPDSVHILSNFAPLPLKQGAHAVRQSLDAHRSGHLFVFLDPDCDAAVADVARSRSKLSYASSETDVRKAICESVALLLEILPSSRADPGGTLPGVRVLLSRVPVPYTSYWTSTSLVYIGLEVLPHGVTSLPRILVKGDSAVALRNFNESVVRSILDEDPREPSVSELLDIAGRVRDTNWQQRIERRLMRA